jgi:hypothetical protein
MCVTNEGEASGDKQEEVVDVSEHQSHEINKQRGEQAHQIYNNLHISNE